MGKSAPRGECRTPIDVHDVGLTIDPAIYDAPLDQGSFAQLERLWRRADLPYDWNPNRLRYRDDAGQTRLTRHGGYLLLSIPSPVSNATATLIWGRGSEDDLRGALARFPVLRAEDDTAAYIRDLGVATVRLMPAPSLGDYLYDLEEQVSLEGKKFQRRRSYLRELQRTTTSVRRETLDLKRTADVSAIWKLYGAWVPGGDPGGTVAEERNDLARSLTGDAAGSLRAIGLNVDGVLAGFAIYDVYGAAATAHFVKAERRSAVYAATWDALFRAAQESGATVLNGGYDGGLQGLRTAKSGLRPVLKRSASLIVAG